MSQNAYREGAILPSGFPIEPNSSAWLESQGPEALGLEALPPGRPALFISHPGHELSVLTWLLRVRPTVFVLTTGTSRTGQPRLAVTADLLRQCGAIPAAPFGRFSDAEIYQALLRGQHDLFLAVVDELAAAFMEHQPSYLVSDAADGYNPAHDLCRILAGAALHWIHLTRGLRIPSFEVPLVVPADSPTAGDLPGQICLELSPAEFGRKLQIARGYTAMRAEVDAAIARQGLEGFRRECLRPVADFLDVYHPRESIPYFEQLGERLVADGHYSEAVRYEQHLRPLIDRILDHVEGHAHASLARLDYQ